MEYSTKQDKEKQTYEIILRGSKELAITALQVLYGEDIIDCDHEFTEEIGVDDTRYFDGAGNLVERSNPDQTRCLICGKIYNPNTEEWEGEQ